MLSKGTEGFETREEWKAAGRQQIADAQTRSAEREASKSIIDMAKELHGLFRTHRLNVWTLRNHSHPDWERIRGNDELVAPRYETLRARIELDDDIETSLNNAEFGHKPKLGERLIPALRDVIQWRRENPVSGNADDELASTLELAVDKAEAMNFVQAATDRAARRAGQSWAL